MSHEDPSAKGTEPAPPVTDPSSEAVPASPTPAEDASPPDEAGPAEDTPASPSAEAEPPAGAPPPEDAAAPAADAGADPSSPPADAAPEADASADTPQAEDAAEEPSVVELLPPAPPDVDELQASLTATRAELAEVTSERDRLARDLEAAQGRLRAVSKAFRDLQGEMDAFRKRQELQAKYKEDRRAFEVVKVFLEPVQNLKRSVETPGEDLAALVHGIGLVHHQFADALAKLGLEDVPGVGAPFDPNLHEALGLTPVFDAEQDGRVLHVHSPGFMVNGRVVQAAQVVVGKLQEAAGEA